MKTASLFVTTSILAVSLLGSTAALAAYQAPTELFCNIAEPSSLICQYFDGKDTKTLEDQDIPGFIDRASINAYVTVKSRKGLERTFLVDPNSVPFRKLAEMKKTSSVSQVSHEKLDIFTEIEKKVIKLSNDLDKASEVVDIVKIDPAVGNDKLNKYVTALKVEIKDKETASEKNAKCGTAREMAALTEENRVLSQYLSSFLQAFQDPESCLGDIKLSIGSDGSVDLSDVGIYSKLFSKYCKRNGKAPGLTRADLQVAKSEPLKPSVSETASISSFPVAASAVSTDSAFQALLARNRGRPELDVDNMVCDNDYLQGPFIIAADACGKTPICYGLARCGKKGESKVNTRITCEAHAEGDYNYCAQPAECLQTKKVMLWSKNIKISKKH